MLVSIVILNWNGKHFLEKYLPGVESHSRLPGVEIIVADNASTDDSLVYLQTCHPNIRIIRLDGNYGFAEGYNRALQQVEADYYVLLNSDVEVTGGWLQPMLEMMQQKQGIAACMPKIHAADRTGFEYAGAAGGFMDKYGYTFCRGRLFHTVEKDTGQYDKEMEIFWATGACCMIHAELFHKTGGFDGVFFAHMEEIDLCWRLKNKGYTIWYTPRSAVYHVGGGMLPQSSPFKTFLNYRNNLLMMYKNLPCRRRKRILYIRTVLDGISAVYSLLKGDVSVLKAVWKAHKDYRKLRRKYRLLPGNSGEPLSCPSCVYRRSIVYQYFIRGRKTFNGLPPDRPSGRR
ncbi:MAG: glycosyltransferase family 2 protein [Bacteroidales bacterium]|jgi:GT2 family glycosyltransferase|nr:glycosyltransferase family 2 protein [Bacteroidales bacterium]